ncbi:hypothetical protein CC1G_00137 [Coprinopsis cinerea okayama7|uniref:Protein-lysine N-methyltransferase EFM6 n=1 Tax=Coprinopsis cinerea (strain Okayama-7 / 130 / ATCC MYA-4618 / FGSC 9003) TaxID=240176 RepID=A8NWW4_COPC7|nr:hypothetical protein CC1G_00137 [Coprinopsis cinerea okayama7\|eukprot:XP_001837001.2 hypothetical protein CC1G_00137 [Coprinopsis cinerea okayama7\
MGLVVEPGVNAELEVEEEQDLKDPLRHLMDTEESIVTVPPSCHTHLLSFLPSQSNFLDEKGGTLKLSFSHHWDSIPHPLDLSLSVDASPGCGGIAWPAGQILATYLVHKGPTHLRNRNVLELGSGTGLVGLVAGLFGNCKVWITDQSPLLPIMQRNVLLNDLNDNVVVAELDWAQPIPSTIPKPDVILAADCVYFEPAFPLLVETLDRLSTKDTEILFCYKKRRKADKRFFSMLKKKFNWKEVDDDPNRASYNREAITLMRLYKVKD